jgi:hypothetical protein
MVRTGTPPLTGTAAGMLLFVLKESQECCEAPLKVQSWWGALENDAHTLWAVAVRKGVVCEVRSEVGEGTGEQRDGKPFSVGDRPLHRHMFAVMLSVNCRAGVVHDSWAGNCKVGIAAGATNKNKIKTAIAYVLVAGLYLHEGNRNENNNNAIDNN